MFRLALLCTFLATGCRTTRMDLSAPLETRLAAWEAAGPTGDAAHRAQLQTLADALRGELAGKARVDVLFICTHNSRRSHLAQILGLLAARRAGLKEVQTFSGGTEATAFNPRAVAALQRAGFVITGGAGENPRYQVQTLPGTVAFSKTIDDASNPKSDFVAVMTCSQADAACPVVRGASKRVSVPYEDPKVADGTAEEAQRYDERTEQIGRDLLWVFKVAAAK